MNLGKRERKKKERRVENRRSMACVALWVLGFVVSISHFLVSPALAFLSSFETLNCFWVLGF